MTNTQNTQTHAQLERDDPRYGFAKVIEIVGTLLTDTDDAQLGDPTPCAAFTVKDLSDHLVMVMQRVAILGNGGHWTEVDQSMAEREHGHAEAFRSAVDDVMAAWADASKLERMYEVPWGQIPGGPAILTYTAELAVHGWDLATATGQPISIPDDYLGGALVAAKMIPDEGRGTDEMPFDAVVDPGADAPVLLQIAGWMGRQVV